MNSEVKVVNKNVSGFGGLWLIGWMFTLGYLHLLVLKGVFALVLWPYYLGISLGH